MSITRTTVLQSTDPSLFSDFLSQEEKEYLYSFPGRTVTFDQSEDGLSYTITTIFDSQELLDQFESDDRVSEIISRWTQYYNENGVTITITTTTI